MRQTLTTNDTAVLVITGECNHIPWGTTAEYVTTLPRSTPVCLPDAGHVAMPDRPQMYRLVVDSFLLANPLPLPAVSPDEPCRR